MTAHLPDWMNRLRCDQTPAWRELGRCYEQTGRAFDPDADARTADAVWVASSAARPS